MRMPCTTMRCSSCVQAEGGLSHLKSSSPSAMPEPTSAAAAANITAANTTKNGKDKNRATVGKVG